MSKTNSSGTVYYFYDFGNILLELNGSGNQISNYTHGSGKNQPLSMTRSSSTFYYISDSLGSIRELADNTQNIVASYQYDAFGTIRYQSGNIWNPCRFTAREFDADTGTYYSTLRYYDPEVGRFMEKFTINLILNHETNLYRYRENNPAMMGMGDNPAIYAPLKIPGWLYLCDSGGGGGTSGTPPPPPDCLSRWGDYCYQQSLYCANCEEGKTQDYYCLNLGLPGFCVYSEYAWYSDCILEKCGFRP